MNVSNHVFMHLSSRNARKQCKHTAFGLWRFRKKETSSSSSWIWRFSPTFSVSADIDVHPCSVVKRLKAHPRLKASNLPTLFMSQSVWPSLSTLWLWQMLFETANNKAALCLKTKEHTRGSACFPGEVPPRVNARPDEFLSGISSVKTIRKICWRFFFFSIHAIRIRWNAILLETYFSQGGGGGGL